MLKSELLLNLLNLFFWIFHCILIVFNTLGWVFKKTRKWNFVTLFLTATSWFGLGYFYGWGYCFCTDWHWQVRYSLGIYDMPESYIKFLLDRITGMDWNPDFVDTITLTTFLLSITASVYTNFRDMRK